MSKSDSLLTIFKKCDLLTRRLELKYLLNGHFALFEAVHVVQGVLLFIVEDAAWLIGSRLRGAIVISLPVVAKSAIGNHLNQI